MTDRLNRYDCIKGFLIFSVVLGHFLEYFVPTHSGAKYLFFMIYTFHMPLFIYISGLFSKGLVNNKSKDIKIAGFAILYIVFKLFLSFSRTIFLGKPFVFNLFTESAAPWYLFTVIFYPLITRVLKKVSPVAVVVSSIVLALIIGYDDSFGDFLICKLPQKMLKKQ